jgi:hypothetical protein
VAYLHVEKWSTSIHDAVVKKCAGIRYSVVYFILCTQDTISLWVPGLWLCFASPGGCSLSLRAGTIRWLNLMRRGKHRTATTGITAAYTSPTARATIRHPPANPGRVRRAMYQRRAACGRSHWCLLRTPGHGRPIFELTTVEAVILM